MAGRLISGGDGIGRIVALGASNLTRGFQTVVSAARTSWGPGVEIFAALGHGRSYGGPSRFLVRGLPGILESGLWRELESRPAASTRGLVTDVGNDILYGSSSGQILEWIADAVARLQRITPDVVLTDLPLASIRSLSNARFLAVRSIFAPSCRLSLTHIVETAERVNAGLETLSIDHRVRLCRLKPDWYGLDPIHIRPSLWRAAWQEILGTPPDVTPDRGSLAEGVRLYFMRPERQSLFDTEQITPQPGVRLPAGGRVFLY